MQELSYAEIAATLDVSDGAVEVLLYRARRRFRTQYERLCATGARGDIARAPRCAQVRHTLAVILDDERRGDERHAVLAHVRSCHVCQGELAAQRAARRARIALPLLPLPPTFHLPSPPAPVPPVVLAG